MAAASSLPDFGKLAIAGLFGGDWICLVAMMTRRRGGRREECAEFTHAVLSDYACPWRAKISSPLRSGIRIAVSLIEALLSSRVWPGERRCRSAFVRLQRRRSCAESRLEWPTLVDYGLSAFGALRM